MLHGSPLVSVLIPNFEHSCYLDSCIQSALKQTYKNLDIVVLDNQSTDDSIAVAKKYVSQGVRVCRNSMNIHNASYNVLAEKLAFGDFTLLLCADDYIMPTFVERAMEIFVKYPNVGYVHGERDFITDEDEVIELDPFFRCSFVAPGTSVMPIYMVTTIAHPAQGIIRKSVFVRAGGYSKEIDHANADRGLWFYLSSLSDYGYIRDKMCRIRIGRQTESFIGMKNLQHPLFMHLTVNSFIRYAKFAGLDGVLARSNDAYSRLARDFLGYSVQLLRNSDFETAGIYLTYAKILFRDIVRDEMFEDISRMCKNQVFDAERFDVSETSSLQRKRSYDPPEGFIEL